jgi:hypothetical protein
MSYDDSNRGALFTPKTDRCPAYLTGEFNVNGVGYYVDLYKTRQCGCQAVLVLKQKRGKGTIVVLLYNSQKGKAVLYGKLGSGYVSVYVNESDNPKAPKLRLTYYEPTNTTEPNVSDDDDDDDEPF